MRIILLMCLERKNLIVYEHMKQVILDYINNDRTTFQSGDSIPEAEMRTISIDARIMIIVIIFYI